MRKIWLCMLAAAFILAGCAGNSVSPVPAESEVSVQEKTQEAETPAAFEVKPEELKDGDRFIVVNPADQRVITSVNEKNTFLGAHVRGNGEALTRIPGAAMIFAFERAENGRFRMKAEDGWLTSGEDGEDLYLEPDSAACSEWEAQPDGRVLCVNKDVREGEEKLYLFLDDYRHEFVAKNFKEDSMDRYVTVFYRLKDDYAPAADDGSGFRLPVFETSDIHGFFTLTVNGSRVYRLARLAKRIEDARRRTGRLRDDTVVLLDGGDLVQGNTLSKFLNGAPVFEAFEEMRYDAITIGNHEFDWGIDNVLDRDATIEDFGQDKEEPNTVPVVMSNLYENGERSTLSQDYVILEKTAVDAQEKEIPVRIGVLGFSLDYELSVNKTVFKDCGFEIREDFELLNTLARKLKETEHCDAVILLSHSDVNDILPHLDSESNVDLILGGHMHVSDFGIAENGISYMQPIGNCEGMGYTELIFGTDASGKAVFLKTTEPTVVICPETEMVSEDGNENIELLDPELKRISDAALDSLQAVMGREIGRISVDVLNNDYLEGSGNRSSTGGNWCTDLYRRAFDADVAFLNPHGVRSEFRIPEGETEMPITVGDIQMMFALDNQLCCFELTYEELLTVFRYSLTEGGSALMGRMSGFDCYYDGKTVNALVKDGETIFAHGKWYNGHGKDKVRLATNEYVATTNRNKGGMDNPLCAWFETERLIDIGVVDNEAAIRSLEKESAENDGHLYIDTKPHFIEGDYTPPEDSR